MSVTVKLEFKRHFITGFLLVFSALLFFTWIDQLLNKQIEAVIQAPMGLSNMIWFWGALSFATSLFFPLLLSLLCCHSLTTLQIGAPQFLKNKFELGLIETLRAWGKTFAWCFVFIIPGLIKYTYYLLAPFVVMFSEKYAAGEVDALEHSKTISKAFWWQLNLWLAVFYMVIPLATSAVLDENKVFAQHPITAVLCVLMETVLLYAFHFLILKSFLECLQKIESVPDPASELKELHGTHV